MKSPKAKGSKFEREICVRLSRWVSHGRRKDVYWRSAMSGGRATVARGKVRQAGDITAVAAEGHWLTDKFFIETKFLKSIDIISLITGKGTLANIWRHVWKESHKYDKMPLLIVKQNHYPILMCVSAVSAQRLGLVPTIMSRLLGCWLCPIDDFLSQPPQINGRDTRPDKPSPWLIIDKMLEKYYSGKLSKSRCVEWHTKTRQMIRVDEHQTTVSRLVCQMVHGAPPTPELEAAHDCGKGHLGCINPYHLAWKTSKDNHADKIKHGTHNRGERHNLSTLSENDIAEIRKLSLTTKQADLARKFNVSQSAIDAVLKKRTWGWLKEDDE